MSAHKTKDGRWRVWLDLGSDPATGQRIRKKVEAKTKREAESRATAIRERHTRGENVVDKPRTLKELIVDWLDTIERQGKAVNTISAYRRASKCQLLPLLGALDVPQLRTRAIQTAFNDLADRLSPTYVRMLKTILVQALNFAIEQGDRTDNPAEKVRIPAVTAKPGRSLTPEEARAVIAVCEGHRYGLAVRFGLMGLRRGEIPGLRWEDFDAVAGTIMVCRQLQRIDGAWKPIPPKRGSIRLLTLGPKMIAALQLLRRAQVVEQQTMSWEDTGYIFISTQNGGPCPPSTIYDSFKAICTTAGIAPARLYDCRHTAATALLADGTDIATVAEVLGHASPLVTMQVYAHALPHRVANASQRLEDIFSKDAEEKETRRRHG
jgi:integrase